MQEQTHEASGAFQRVAPQVQASFAGLVLGVVFCMCCKGRVFEKAYTVSHRQVELLVCTDGDAVCQLYPGKACFEVLVKEVGTAKGSICVEVHFLACCDASQYCQGVDHACFCRTCYSYDRGDKGTFFP